MARRMFAPQIIDSDAFLDMPTSAQSLYFHLGMRADDDGFVGNPKKIQRMIGSNEDDLKLLIAKRFVLVFESGVIVIKHWRINNLIRKDWYKETVYLEEKNQLEIKDNGAYTERFVNETTPKLSRRLGKVRLGKDKESGESDAKASSFAIIPSKEDSELAELLLSLIKQNTPTFKQPNVGMWANHIRLLREQDGRTLEQIEFVIRWSQKDTFWQANILSTKKLREKFDTLVAHIKRDVNKENTKKSNIAFS